MCHGNMVIIGIDLGKARTGLSICDKAEMLAVPLCVLTERNRERLVELVYSKAKDAGAQVVVIGLPRNMDGTEGESAKSAREFGALFSEKSGIEIDYIDERGTTITAHGYLNDTNVRGKKRKQTVDSVAATVILQNYLDKRKNANKH